LAATTASKGLHLKQPLFIIIIIRFVGNFGAIVFAPVGGWLIDSWDLPGTDFSPVFYIYLGLKLQAAFLILFVR
jgi:hypothetical protein